MAEGKGLFGNFGALYNDPSLQPYKDAAGKVGNFVGNVASLGAPAVANWTFGKDNSGKTNPQRIFETMFVPSQNQTGSTLEGDWSKVTGGNGTYGGTGDTYGGSGGGGLFAPSMNSMMSDAQRYGLFQGIPDFDTGDFDSEMNKAIGSFSNLQNTLMGLQPAALAELDRSYASGRANLEDYRQRGAGEIQRAGATAGERTESAINEARRVGAELQQGIQSRFGAQTGTGGFSGEITGRETQRNIGQQRQQFEQTMRDLTAASQDLEREVSTKIFQLDTELMNSKSALERDLRTRLAEIETDKGMLRADKAKTKLGALQDYKRLVAEIEGNNTATKQSLYSTYLDQQMRVKEAQSQASWLSGLQGSVDSSLTQGTTEADDDLWYSEAINWIRNLGA